MLARLCSVGERGLRRGVPRHRALCVVLAALGAMPAIASAFDRDECLTNTRPVADAGPNRSETSGATIEFDATNSYDPDGRDLNYIIWYFGDGQVSRGAVVSHTYHQPGTYVVTLTVTDVCRTRGTDHAIVTITGDSTDPGDPCDGNVPPTAHVSGSPSAVLGDAILFNGNTSSDSDGQIDKFAWDFGDGSTAVGSFAGHNFLQPGTFTVTLTVTDDCGATDTDVMVVTITEPDPCAGNEAPVANAGLDRSAEPGRTLWFSGANSRDADGWIAAYEWNFGDGSSTSGRTVPHVFADPGTYDVSLTVTDNCGASASQSVTVSIVAADPCAGNQAPTANAGSNRMADVGATLTFDAGGSSDDGTITSFRWTFGDGASATGRAVSHAFDEAGTYTVTLTVTDDCGASASASVVATVSDPDNGGSDVVSAAFGFTPQAPRVQDMVAFSADQAAAFEGDFYFRWDFGDGSYPGYGGAQVTRPFADPGSYTVTLTLIDKFNWQIVATESRTVVVGERLTVTGALSGTLANNNGIVVVGDNVWVCGSPNKVVVVDASNAAEPRLIEARSVNGGPSSVCANDAVVAVAATYGGVLLFDATDGTAMTQVGHIDTYADGGFRAFGVALDGSRLLVTGEWGGLRVFDVSNPSAPVKLSSNGDVGFLRRIKVHNGRAYVLDASLPGVRVFSLANVSNPVEIGRVLTNDEPLRFDVASTSEGVLLAVAEGSGGLEVFDVTNPSASRFLSRSFGVNGVGGVVLRGTTAYVGYMSAVVELDLSVPSDPRELAFVPLGTGLPTAQVRFSDGRVFAGFKGGLVAVLQP